MAIETVALTLKQVRQRLNRQWIAEKQMQQSEDKQDDSTNKLQENGDVHGHPLRQTE